MVLIKENDKEKVQIQDQIQAKPLEDEIEKIPRPENDVIFEVKQCSNGMGMFALKDIFPGKLNGISDKSGFWNATEICHKPG